MAMPCTVRQAARYRLANYLRGAHLASRPGCLRQCRAGEGVGVDPRLPAIGRAIWALSAEVIYSPPHFWETLGSPNMDSFARNQILLTGPGYCATTESAVSKVMPSTVA